MKGGKRPNVMRTQEKRDDRPTTREPAPPADDGKSRGNALRAVTAALEKKGLEPVLLDVRAMASYTDYILIVSGRSDRQVQAISDGIVEAFAAEGKRPFGVEGMKNGQWTLVDLGDVVVHVFYHPARDHYDLESLWSDAPRVALEVPPEARVQPGEMY